MLCYHDNNSWNVRFALPKKQTNILPAISLKMMKDIDRVYKIYACILYIQYIENILQISPELIF